MRAKKNRGDGGAARGDGDGDGDAIDSNRTSFPFLILLAGDPLALPFVRTCIFGFLIWFLRVSSWIRSIWDIWVPFGVHVLASPCTPNGTQISQILWIQEETRKNQIKNPKIHVRTKGREGEREGITGKKDEEGEGCTPGVDGVVVAVASRRPSPPSPPLWELVVASPLVLASRRTSRRLPPGSDPEGRRCGFVPGRGGSGMAKPGPFLFRAVSNRKINPSPT